MAAQTAPVCMPYVNGFNRCYQWAPKRSRAGLILPVRNSPACNSARIYQTIARSIQLYDCETWPVRAAHKRMPAQRCRDCVQTMELRRHLCLYSIPRNLRWLVRAMIRPEGELIRGLPPVYSHRAGRRLQPRSMKTWNLSMEKGFV